MTTQMQPLWQQLQADLSGSFALPQLAIICFAIAIAWGVNGALRAYVMKSAPENFKLAIGSINRLLFPLSTILMLWIGQWLLADANHVSLLQLAIKLMFAMAAVRLFVYGLRYIFSPSGSIKALENTVAWSIWSVMALHILGYWPQIVRGLQDVQFHIGKTQVNLWVILQGVFVVVATLFVTLWISRLLENKLMAAQHVSVNMRVVMAKIIRIVLIFVSVLFALSAVGLDITLLSVFGGALGVGLGFGLQKIASNYVSGFIILLDKSMHIGDMITVDKHFGVIQDMRSRYMVLGKQDGTSVIIPNETLITCAVINHSLTEHRGRVQVQVCVSFASSVERAIELMREIAIKNARVLTIPTPDVLVKGFAENGVELVLNAWVADPEKPLAPLQSALYMEIWRAFQTNKIMLTKHAVPEV